jgi:hypothetical protein
MEKSSASCLFQLNFLCGFLPFFTDSPLLPANEWSKKPQQVSPSHTTIRARQISLVIKIFSLSLATCWLLNAHCRKYKCVYLRASRVGDTKSRCAAERRMQDEFHGAIK